MKRDYLKLIDYVMYILLIVIFTVGILRVTDNIIFALLLGIGILLYCNTRGMLGYFKRIKWN